MGLVLDALFRSRTSCGATSVFAAVPPARPSSSSARARMSAPSWVQPSGVFTVVDVDEAEVRSTLSTGAAEGVFGVALEALPDGRTLARSVTRASFTGTIPVLYTAWPSPRCGDPSWKPPCGS